MTNYHTNREFASKYFSLYKGDILNYLSCLLFLSSPNFVADNSNFY